MVSNCFTYKDSLVCELSYLELHDKFEKTQDQESISDAIEELIKVGLVAKNKQTLEIGYVTENRKVLFTGTTDTLDAEYDELMEYADSFVESFRSSTLSSAAIKVKREIQVLFEKGLSRWTIYDYMSLFRFVSTVYFQDFQRDFSKQEFGTMKNFAKLYDSATTIKLIIYYLLQNEKYHKSIPTIGLLIYHKDSVYKDCMGVSKKSKIVRTTKLKSEDNF